MVLFVFVMKEKISCFTKMLHFTSQDFVVDEGLQPRIAFGLETFPFMLESNYLDYG